MRTPGSATYGSIATCVFTVTHTGNSNLTDIDLFGIFAGYLAHF